MNSLQTTESEYAPAVAQLVALVQKVVAESGDSNNFDAAKWTAQWLCQPNPALGGQVPDTFMATAEGQQQIASIITRMQSGAFA